MPPLRYLTIGLVLILSVVVIAAGGGVGLFVVVFPIVCAYLCYRIIRGGFTNSQSTKLSIFGWIGCVILVVLALRCVQWALEVFGVL
jgi:hypothetical protein